MTGGGQLDLFEGPGEIRIRTMWDGRYPRELTRGHEVFILKAQAEKKHGRIDWDVQGCLWPADKGKSSQRGAPLLLKLPTYEEAWYGARRF